MSGWAHHFFGLGDLALWLLLGVILLGLVVPAWWPTRRRNDK
jgi:hypothetical protein